MEINQASQKVIRDHYQALESSLDAQALSGALFSRGLITLELNEELSLVHTTRTQKNGILLRYLLRNPAPNLILQLCDILNAEEANRHLANLLKGSKSSSADHAYTCINSSSLDAFSKEQMKMPAVSQAPLGNNHLSINTRKCHLHTVRRSTTTVELIVNSQLKIFSQVNNQATRPLQLEFMFLGPKIG